jgi:dCMP deaminase
MQSIIEQIKALKHRPSWNEYFMSMCYLIAQRSSCDRLHVGSVIVKDNRIVTCGYNGFIAGAPHESVIIDGHEQMTIHAETNAVTDAAKRGVTLNESIVYITHFPCINCTKVLISAGIKTIIYSEDYKNNELVYKLCKSANVQIYQYNNKDDIIMEK